MSKCLVSPRSGRILFIGVTLTAGFLLSTPASAQQNYAEILDWYGRVMEAQIPKFLERIRPNMTASERNIADYLFSFAFANIIENVTCETIEADIDIAIGHSGHAERCTIVA